MKIINTNRRELLKLTIEQRLDLAMSGMQERNESLYNRRKEILEGKNIPGFKCGFLSIDQKMHGFKKSQITVLSGRSGAGKTTWDANLIHGFLRSNAGIRILFFSLDVTKDDICRSLAAIRAGVSENTILAENHLSDEQRDEYLSHYKQCLESERVHILENDCKYTANDVVRAYKYMMNRGRQEDPDFKYDIVMLDHFQKICSKPRDGMSKFEIMDDSADLLQGFVEDNDICMILNSQVNRTSNRGGNTSGNISGSAQLEANCSNNITIFPEEIDEGHKLTCFNRGLLPCQLVFGKARGPINGKTLRFGYCTYDETIKELDV